MLCNKIELYNNKTNSNVNQLSIGYFSQKKQTLSTKKAYQSLSPIKMGRNKKCVKKKFCLQIWMVWYTLFYLTFTWFLFSNDWYLKYFWFTSIYWITIIAFVCFFGTDNLSRINGNILWISSCFLYLICESDRKLVQ